MSTRRIQEFLDGNKVHYSAINHHPAFSACEVAHAIHISGRTLAKVVVVVIEKKLALAVVPSTCEVDFIRLQRTTGMKSARLAHESEFADRFEGCQLGAMPPFGVLFGMETYVDMRLISQTHIAFNAGTHLDVIVMSSDDYVELARPRLADIAADSVREPLIALSL